MKSHRSCRTAALSCALATGWLVVATLSAAAMAPSFNRDVSASPVPGAVNTTAALTLTVRTCPAGYDPARAGADYLRDCREPAGDTTFHVNQEGTTGPSASTGTSGDAPQESTVKFSGFAPGRYSVLAEAPKEIGSAFVGGCASNARSFEGYPLVPFARVVDATVTIEVVPGETLACDWYQVNATQ